MTKRTLTQILTGVIIIIVVVICVSLSKCHNSTKTENNGRPDGSTTINIVDKGSVNESVTHATIGQGNIEIADGSDISGINRDVNKTETTTKDQITGALDATVSIDNRLLIGQVEEWADTVFNQNAEHYDEKNKLQKDYFAGSTSTEDNGILPTLGLKPSHVGRETIDPKTKMLTESYKEFYAIKNDKGEIIGYKKPEDLSLWEKITSPFDLNPLFKLGDAIIPGLHSGANVHDPQFLGVDNAEILRNSILPSFFGTYFSTIYGKLPSKLNKIIEKNKSNKEKK